jgi:hypothetical protein
LTASGRDLGLLLDRSEYLSLNLVWQFVFTRRHCIKFAHLIGRHPGLAHALAVISNHHGYAKLVYQTHWQISPLYILLVGSQRKSGCRILVRVTCQLQNPTFGERFFFPDFLPTHEN